MVFLYPIDRKWISACRALLAWAWRQYASADCWLRRLLVIVPSAICDDDVADERLNKPMFIVKNRMINDCSIYVCSSRLLPAVIFQFSRGNVVWHTTPVQSRPTRRKQLLALARTAPVAFAPTTVCREFAFVSRTFGPRTKQSICN